MTPRLYQGVEGVADRSQQLFAAAKAFHSEGGLCSGRVDVPTIPSTIADADTLHEECGVVAIHGHPDAARQAYLGLYALQHRGQESAGIATADGQRLANICLLYTSRCV